MKIKTENKHPLDTIIRALENGVVENCTVEDYMARNKKSHFCCHSLGNPIHNIPPQWQVSSTVYVKGITVWNESLLSGLKHIRWIDKTAESKKHPKRFFVE